MTRPLSAIIEAMRVSIGLYADKYTLEDVINRLQAVLDGESDSLDLNICFRYEEQRDAFIALFPKYVRWYRGGMTGLVYGEMLPTAVLQFEFHRNIAGERNETGEKRLRKAVEVLRTLE